MSRILRQGLGYYWSVTLPEYRRRGFFTSFWGKAS